MKTLDRNAVQQMSDALMANLKSLEAQFGVKFNYKGGSYTNSNVVFRVEAALVGAGGEVKSIEREAYKRSAEVYGLKKEWLDKPFSFSGNTYTVYGLKTRCCKSPVLVVRSDGRRFKMTVPMVADAFKLQTVV
jgi:hypothetical protein